MTEDVFTKLFALSIYKSAAAATSTLEVKISSFSSNARFNC